jgi:Ras GTPase-activating-like protein IQGAP2/3
VLGAKERRYLKDLLGAVINDTVNDDNERGIMNIETDPIKVRGSLSRSPFLNFTAWFSVRNLIWWCVVGGGMQIYRSVINEEETRTGIQSTRPLDVTFNEALADQETLALFIKRGLSKFLL